MIDNICLDERRQYKHFEGGKITSIGPNMTKKIWTNIGRAHTGSGIGPTGLNFINVLCTSFTLVDPKSVKRYL